MLTIAPANPEEMSVAVDAIVMMLGSGGASISDLRVAVF